MSKINNTTAYATTIPTNNTMFIGSETAGGATKNYKVSDLSSFINLNPTLTSLTVSGDATIGGQLLVSGLLQVGSFTMTAVPIFFNGINVGGTLTASGLPKLTGLSTFADNAAALGGGLVADDVYKTATGELRIVV